MTSLPIAMNAEEHHHNNNNNNSNSTSTSSESSTSSSFAATAAAAVESSNAGAGGGRRRKIQIKKIENQSSLFVAFSKRKNGLFKKMQRYVDLSHRGTQAAVVTFSPAAIKAHAYGSPAVDAVLDRFMRQAAPAAPAAAGNSRKEAQILELEELEAAWLRFRDDLEKRMTEEQLREARTRKFFV